MAGTAAETDGAVKEAVGSFITVGAMVLPGAVSAQAEHKIRAAIRNISRFISLSSSGALSIIVMEVETQINQNADFYHMLGWIVPLGNCRLPKGN